MSSSDSNDDDDDFFDQCFAIDAKTNENGNNLRQNNTNFVIDSDDEGDDCEENVIFSAIRTLQAAYRGVAYSVHYLDLTEEEFGYFKMGDVNYTNITLSVKKCHIFIDENMFSIKRLALPSELDDPVSEITKTERIFFTTCEPLLAKCDRNFFFVHENLRSEYEMLLKNTKKPMGTTIRVKKNRIIANRAENVLNILESDVRLSANNTLYVLTPDEEIHIERDVGNEQWKRYIVNQDNELVNVERSLLHNVSCQEIFAVYDIVKEQSIDDGVVAHQETDGDPENDEHTNSEISAASSYDEPELQMMRLPQYAVSESIRQLIRGPSIIETEALSEKIRTLTRNKTLLSRTMPDDYEEVVTCMIDLEDETEAVFVEKFDQANIKLTKFLDRVVYFSIEKRHAELAAAIEEKYVDFVTLIAETEGKRKSSFDGQIDRKYDGKIYIKLFDYVDFGRLNTNHTYFMHCLSNRVTFQVTKLCQQFCARDQLIPLLLYNPRFYNREKLEAFKDKKPLKGSLAQTLNSEQKSVVSNILQRRSNMLPFILFGPPGTGKTRTLVAAIEEIIKTTDQYVLVCATSNSACDEIAERLLDVIEDEYDMYRMFARSVLPDRVCPRLKRVSNLRDGKHFNPALKILYRYRVIITTLCTSSCFARAHIEKTVYDPKHFSYVFIDECSSASEVLTLVPIAGVCSTKRKIEAQIILAGDPRQLGPVIRNRRSSALGYATSYIDRLMNCELYKVDVNSGKFNQKYIVQLVKNYRSHNAILRVPNELFYSGKLVAKANKDITDCFIGHHLLPNKNIPIIFHSIQGTCEILPGECSSFNNAEIEKVLYYVQKLLPNRAYHDPKNCKITAEDIGIVTPYRKQCQKIRERLKKLGYSEIVVGSAEVFQGKEKPVIIVSTVRSGGIDLGFVSDKRRLNVMITRAKSLLIIIGNPFTLRLDKNWAKMINYCDKSKAIIHNKII